MHFTNENISTWNVSTESENFPSTPPVLSFRPTISHFQTKLPLNIKQTSNWRNALTPPPGSVARIPNCTCTSALTNAHLVHTKRHSKRTKSDDERQFSDILPPRSAHLCIDAVLRYNLLARKCGALLAGTSLAIFACPSTANWPCGLAC